MKRREFIAALGSATVTWPPAARAQQPAMPVIGFLHGESADMADYSMRAFHQGLSQIGFVEGRNVAIEYRFAEGQDDRLPAMAADLVRRRVAVIVTPASTSAAFAAKAATTTIPIVFLFAGDPVAFGLVASLNRPGGNLTGVTTLNIEVGAKRFELLRELLPAVSAMTLLVNPRSPGAETQSREAGVAARTLGLQLNVLQAGTERDIDTAFTSLLQSPARGLVIAPNPYFYERREQLVGLTLRHGVPTVFTSREFVAAGGLMSYGTDGRDLFRIVGSYTGRILKGEKPADLPVQQATRIELVINMKTAKALGLTFPITLLGRADEVIE
jgi:putative ABC transport system substrate-binding protein